MREMRKGSGISGSWEGAWLLGETGKPQCVCVRERERERERDRLPCSVTITALLNYLFAFPSQKY